MIDKRLLQLENLVNRQEEYDLNEIAEVLQISERQLVRQLNNWQKEGYIDYLPGKGRGNKVKIKLLVNVEQETLQDILAGIHEMKLSEIQKYIDFPWNEKSVHAIQQTINRYLNNIHHNSDSIYEEYIPYMPDALHPAYLNDNIGAQVSYQIFESLYRVTSDGKVKRNLLRFDEWQEADLHLYLKKDIRFSNGSLLTAHDVKNVLEKLMTESLYAAIFTIIEQIEIIDNDYLILKFNQRPKFFEYTLSSRYSAIYKKLPTDAIVGTGPYYLDAMTEEQIVLVYNSYYRGGYPDIERIYLTLAKEAPSQSGVYPYRIPLGDEFLLFNPHKKLTIKQREFISRLFIYLLNNIMKQQQLTIINHMVTAEMPLEAPAFDQPVKVIANAMTMHFYEQLQQLFKRYGIEFQIIEMSHLKYLNTHLLNVDADFIWMYESYHSLQPYKTIDLLTQCKFQEWYGTIDEADRFIHDLLYRPHESDRVIAQQYLRKLERQQLFVPLFTQQKQIMLPTNMKNVHPVAYGTLDYRLLMVDY